MMTMILRMMIAVLQHSWRGDFDCKDKGISDARITIMKRPPALLKRTVRVRTTIIVLQRLLNKK